MRVIELFPLELGAFLESLRRTATPHAQSEGVGLDAQPTESPLFVKADRYLLERAVLNLLSNAIEASPRGAVVRLRAGHQGTSCTIEVMDRGPGIAPERLSHLFDAFASTKRTGAHLGMGLPNVKRIVQAHGGLVSAESELGSGTTFRITLPEAQLVEVREGEDSFRKNEARARG
jgi:signal transduction histidine kinase